MTLHQRFSQNFKRSLRTALQLAVDLGVTSVEPIHLLYGLAIQPSSLSSELFSGDHITPDELLEAVAKNTSNARPYTSENLAYGISPSDLTLSRASQNIVQKSIHIAHTHNHHYVGTEHLLAAILATPSPAITKVLADVRLDRDSLTDQTDALLRSTSKLPDLTGAFHSGENHSDSNESALELFAQELTASPTEKNSQTLDPVIGRQTEIDRIVQILARRQKNNPLLIGEPGVGKTAIVEGLAKLITAGQVPSTLIGKKIYALDMTGIVAGTIYRGEFEQRVKQLVDEIKKRPEVILFIDEIHSIVGTGAAAGSLDAANILKPALARGQIRCIGTTTFADYRRTIEHDPALERRFQIIRVSEPDPVQARSILGGIKEYYESFHQVVLTDPALDAAVNLSQRYITDKFLPDKAIDLIDEASARANVNRRPGQWEDKLGNLRDQLQTATDAKTQAIAREDYVAALEYKRICSNLATALTEAESQAETNRRRVTVTDRDIAAVIATATGIPLADITADSSRQISRLEKDLAKQVIGQDQAIATITSTIKLAKAGLRASDRPLASLLFAGPSGVGKTHTAKTLARTLFGSDQALIRIDMSEYGERFNVSKLIGSPAGYVGYRESGHLTERVKHRPYSLVLFDEVEKADPAVFDLLLQVLDDGYLTDAAGSRINFRNTVIIMTSNLGSHLFKTKEKIGFSGKAGGKNNTETKMVEEVRAHFKPEFINRLDHIVYFQPLTERDIAIITKNSVTEINQHLADQQLKLTLDDKVVDHLVQASLTADQGIRGLRRLIRDQIETRLADLIISGKTKNKNSIRASVKNGIIEVK